MSDVQVSVPSPATVPELFEAQVRRTPDNTAVAYGTDTLTYAELNTRANQMAHWLIEQGAGPETFVALVLPRSLDLVIAILAVLKTGAAYVPIDPGYPTDRITTILTDAEPLITLDTTHPPPDLTTYPHTNPTDNHRTTPLTPHNTAYIIYTSGSTGRPKGVLVPHTNIARLFTATHHWYDFGEHDTWTLFHSFAFDFSVWELWGALLHGGRLIVVPFDITRSPTQFLTLLAEEHVTVLNQTPSAFYQLMQTDHDHPTPRPQLALRYVIFGGEALDLQRLNTWYQHHPDTTPVLVNMYGITETTVHVSYAPLTQDTTRQATTSTIGETIPDLRAYILDQALRPVPPGHPGELYIAGNGLEIGLVNG